MSESNNDIDVSVCIPYAEDWPHIYFTANQAALILVLAKLRHEIIITVNNTKEENIGPMLRLLTNRDFGDAHNIRIIHSDIPSNGIAANVAAKAARGKYLCLMDSHVVLHPNIFTECIKVIDNDEKAGLVHAPISWTGVPHDADFNIDPRKRCYQYLYRVWDPKKRPGEWYLNQGLFTGTYSHYLKSPEPHPIAGCGHGFFMVLNKTWQKIGGYHSAQRSYGGRESFVTFKSWLFGFKNYTVPTTHHIHYSGRRFYQWRDEHGHQGNDVIWRNAMTQAYSIGGTEWLDKTYAAFLKKKGVRKDVVEKLRREAIEWSAAEREYVLKNQLFSFDDLLKQWAEQGLFH